jgi:hypothetical protein
MPKSKDVKTVFGKKHREGLDEALQKMFRRVHSHIPMPEVDAGDVLSMLVRPEHRDILKQTEAVVGKIQSHTTVYLAFSDKPSLQIQFSFPMQHKLLPRYAEKEPVNVEIDREFWAPILSWRDQRIEVGAKFSRVSWLLNHLDYHAGTIANVKFYFAGITPLMAMVPGMERRTDLTRESKMPANLVGIHPEVRAMKKEADATISTAMLYEEEQECPSTYFALYSKPNISVPFENEKMVW